MGSFLIFDQSKLPQSHIYPPTDAPEEPKYFVDALTVISTPNALASHRYGVVSVLSRINGIACFFAHSDIKDKLGTSNLGLPKLSTKIAAVDDEIAASMSFISVGSTYLIDMQVE